MVSIVAIVIFFVSSPFKYPFSKEATITNAVSIGLIGGATTNSSFEDGVLSIEIHGGAVLDIAIAKTYYAEMQLPSSLGHLLEHEEIRKHIKLKHSTPAPLLGFIPIKGEIKGDQLLFDLTNNIVSGAVEIPINLSLAGVYKFTFEIDIAALEETIEFGTYDFKINVGDNQLDLPLLEFPESTTSLDFEYNSPGGGNGDGEDGDGPGEDDPNKTSTKASVSFLPNEISPPVVDPTDPDKPYEPDPTDPTDPQDPPTNNEGELTLDYVSSIHFEEQVVESHTQVYKSHVLRPFIQVSDRRGTKEGDGWAVTAKISAFETDDETDTLRGSVLTFRNGSTISPGKAEKPFSYPEIQLYPGGESTWVIWAEGGTGLGTWVNRWLPTATSDTLNDNVTLEVPGGSATIGTHQATISWTLTNAPS